MKKLLKFWKSFTLKLHITWYLLSYPFLYRRFTDKDKKPPVPYKMYCAGILLYTIKDWTWIEPGSKEIKVLKSGWFGGKIQNSEHPVNRWRLQNVLKRQQAIEAQARRVIRIYP